MGIGTRISRPSRLLIIILLGIVFLTLRPYASNVTALFHMDADLARGNALPRGFVVLSVPAYDGAQYYHVARNIPKLLDRSEWKFVRMEIPPSYGYQRFLLPLFAFALALGRVDALPYTFLLINLASLLGACVLMEKYKKKPLYALALALSPAALVGLHFTLAEPLAILLLTWFLLRFEKTKAVGLADVLLLSLLVLAREVNIFFVGALFAYLMFRRQWKGAALSLVPALVFLLFHAFLYVVFNDIAFLDSGAKRALPFQAVIPLLVGQSGYDRYTLSSIVLFAFFVAPALAFVAHDVWKRKTTDFLPWASAAFLLMMTMMPDFIWGSMTSIGRVITPVYPLFLTYAASRDTLPARLIAWAVLGLGLAIGIGLALIQHPHTIV